MLSIISLEKKRLNDSSRVWTLFAGPRDHGVCFNMLSAPRCCNLMSSEFVVHNLVEILEFLFSRWFFLYIVSFIILVILSLVVLFTFTASRHFFRNNIIVIIIVIFNLAFFLFLHFITIIPFVIFIIIIIITGITFCVYFIFIRKPMS